MYRLSAISDFDLIQSIDPRQVDALLASTACFQPLPVANMGAAINIMDNVNAHQDGQVLIASHRVCFSSSFKVYLRQSFSECDSLADRDHRRPREEGESCKCKDGWGGINCNGASTSSAHDFLLICY